MNYSSVIRSGMARVNKELHRIKAKFHYAILVAERFEAGRRPAASWNLAYSAHELAGLRPASDHQLR